jgi:hypothetical protein
MVRVKEEQFRKLALALPEVVEGAHMNHPDFRVRGRIYATLLPDAGQAMVSLTPEQQAAWVERDPEVFEPAAGAWGRKGSTLINLPLAKPASVKQALREAWEHQAR